MVKVWIDDLRGMPDGYDICFSSVNKAIEFLNDNYQQIEVLDLDHDAGIFAEQGGDYIEILRWMETNGISVPILIHSGNQEGIEQMEEIIKRNGWVYLRHNDEFDFRDGF